MWEWHRANFFKWTHRLLSTVREVYWISMATIMWSGGEGKMPTFTISKKKSSTRVKAQAFSLKPEALVKMGCLTEEYSCTLTKWICAGAYGLMGYKVVICGRLLDCFSCFRVDSVGTDTKSKMYYYTRNHILMLIKNYGIANLVKAILVSLLFESRNIALFLARQKPLVALSLIEGLAWNG